jgi:predicted transcriptional regulator YdeE
MHDWVGVASDGSAAIFRGAEETRFQTHKGSESKDCQMKRAQNAHDRRASNQGLFARVRIREQKYAVFTHSDHVSSIRRTFNSIWNNWLPASGQKMADAPTFERYGENFDPLTGNGGFEIWVPVRD